MTVYQQIIGRPLPENSLLLPLQYPIFGDIHHCLLFASLEKELGKGTAKRVEQAYIQDMIGEVPLPEVASLKGQRIVLYRPREDPQAFINDIIAIVKLGQVMLHEQNARANVVKIKGHSLYIGKELPAGVSDFFQLLYGGYLKLSLEPAMLINILQKAFTPLCPHAMLEQIGNEVLHANDLVNSPFMLADIFPISVHDAVTQMRPETILYNVYQMVYTVAAYAAEGIFFRDLQPDNFRFNNNYQVKLIDPSYIAASVRSENRFSLFVKQTTPEYLPNVFSDFYRNNQQEKLIRYFGEFTEGVCIGMLERVLRRIFLPKYMGKKYDELYRQYNPSKRIEITNELKLQENLDLFRDMIDDLPSPRHFSQYHDSITALMQQEKIFPEAVIATIPRLLTILRRFSYPVFNPNSSQSLLEDEQKKPLSISQLPNYLKASGMIPSVPFASPLTKRRPAAPEDALNVIFDNQDTVRPILNTKKHTIAGIQQKAAAQGELDKLFEQATFKKQEAERETKETDPSRMENMPITEAKRTPVLTRKIYKTPMPRPFALPREVLDKIFEDAPLKRPDGEKEPEIFRKDDTNPNEGTRPSLVTKKLIKSPALQKMLQSQNEELPLKSYSRDSLPPENNTSWSPNEEKIIIISEDSKAPTDTTRATNENLRDSKTPGTTRITNENLRDSKPPTGTTRATNENLRDSKLPTGATRSTNENPRENQPKAPGESTTSGKGNAQIVGEVVALSQFIEDQLHAIKMLLQDNPDLAPVFKKNLRDNLQYRALDEIKTFLAKANNLFQDPELEFMLRREVQPLVASDMNKILERYAPDREKSNFRNINAAHKCKRILHDYLIYTAKTRFLITTSMEVNIVDCLPKSQEDVLQFICQHLALSLEDLAKAIAEKLQKAGRVF